MLLQELSEVSISSNSISAKYLPKLQCLEVIPFIMLVVFLLISHDDFFQSHPTRCLAVRQPLVAKVCFIKAFDTHFLIMLKVRAIFFFISVHFYYNSALSLHGTTHGPSTKTPFNASFCKVST